MRNEEKERLNEKEGNMRRRHGYYPMNQLN